MRTGENLIYDVLEPIIIDVDYLVNSSEQMFASSTSEYSAKICIQLGELFQLFARSRPIYDQIRLLDAEGKECLRINTPSDNIPVAVVQNKLQDKSKRYYFRDTFNLKKEELFISPLDLNIENGEIERPLKPMLRFGRPLFNKQNKKIGIVLINYKVDSLFKKIHHWSRGFQGEIALLNRDGYWLHAAQEADEWGFMLAERQEKNFKHDETNIWENSINVLDSGHVYSDDGLYTFRTVRPLEDKQISSDGASTAFANSGKTITGDQYYWKLLSFISNENIEEILTKIRWTASLYCYLSLLVIGIFSFFLARAHSRRMQYSQALKSVNFSLESTVIKRTKELSKRNLLLTEQIQAREKVEIELVNSENRYRSIMDTMSDGVYITGQDYTVTYSNQALDKRLGRSAAGECCYNALYGRDSKCPWCVFDDMDEGKPHYYEIKSDDEKTYHVANAILKYADEKRGKLTIFRDITDYVQTKNELEESERYYSTLIETMREGVVTVGVNAKITFCNAAFCKMLGLIEQQVVDKQVIDFLDGENREIFNKEFEKRQHNISEPYEITWTKGNGEKIITTISPATLKDKDNTFLGAVGVISDITAEKLAEVEKRSLEEQLMQSQKMESLGTLAGGIAHDFNNILAAILGYSQLSFKIVKKLEDTKLENYLGQIIAASKRATELVRQILTFARQSNQHRQPLAIGPIIKEVVRFLRSATSTIISIEVNIEEEVGEILADPTQIHQILMNLCTNSCHAMFPAGGNLAISLRSKNITSSQARIIGIAPGNVVSIEVADTGLGIPQELLNKIFDPFFTTKEVGKGTGLGLSVIHSIVKDLDGAIEVESAEEQGTVFKVYLPITEQREKMQAVVTERLIYGSGEKIAWIDDERPLVKLGVRALSALRYKVSGFTCPQEFLDVLKDSPHKFDLIISDYNMPYTNGLELLHEVQSLNSDVPFIICSGFSEEINKNNASETGVNAFLMKPVSNHDIAKAVHEALQ